MKTKRLWLRNSSRYSDAEVWPLVQAAYESVERSLCNGQTLRPIIVQLTNCCHAYRGRAHWVEWHPGPDGKQVMWLRVLVRIGTAKHFPQAVRYPRFKGDMPEYECRTYREGIVMVTAHEIEHTLGASGRKDGEFRCEMAAWDAIDFYRKQQSAIDTAIQARLTMDARRSEARQHRVAAKQSPQAHLAKWRAAEARWLRKKKMCETKLHKIRREIYRYERKLEQQANQPTTAL